MDKKIQQNRKIRLLKSGPLKHQQTFSTISKIKKAIGA
jgi:hypothetical protein